LSIRLKAGSARVGFQPDISRAIRQYRPRKQFGRSHKGETTMRKILLLTTALALSPALAWGQTTEELYNDGKNPDNVLTQSMGLARNSYSPLAQIDKSNVKRLVPIWSTSLMNDAGELAAPVVYDGVVYAINAKWTFAINVASSSSIAIRAQRALML
jgi:hypothetical protein